MAVICAALNQGRTHVFPMIGFKDKGQPWRKRTDIAISDILYSKEKKTVIEAEPIEIRAAKEKEKAIEPIITINVKQENADVNTMSNDDVKEFSNVISYTDVNVISQPDVNVTSNVDVNVMSNPSVNVMSNPSVNVMSNPSVRTPSQTLTNDANDVNGKTKRTLTRIRVKGIGTLKIGFGYQSDIAKLENVR